MSGTRSLRRSGSHRPADRQRASPAAALGCRPGLHDRSGRPDSTQAERAPPDLRYDRFLDTLYQAELAHIPFPDEPPVGGGGIPVPKSGRP